MSGNPSKITVAVLGKREVICPHGRASFTCSADFKRLVYELMDGGCRYFVLELSKCTIMDSTFLGILVWFARKFEERNKGEGGLVLLNASSKIQDLITSLGMMEFFTIAEGKASPEGGVKEFEMAQGDVSKAEHARLALEAHQILMEANPENVGRFQDVVKFLEQDWKKSMAQGEDDGGGLERAH